MRTIKLNTLTNKIFIGAFALLILFSFDASAKKVKFQTSKLVPAARGYVKIHRDISNLAEAFRLQPSRLNYIVWMVTDEELTMNMGKIKSTVGILSKDLKAKFETVTSLKPVKIFITAEDDPSRQYPGTEIALTTNTF